MIKYQAYIIIGNFLLRTCKSKVTDNTYTYIYKKEYNKKDYTKSCSLCDVNQGYNKCPCSLCIELLKGKSDNELYSVISYGTQRLSASLYFRSIGSLYSSKVVKLKLASYKTP